MAARKFLAPDHTIPTGPGGGGAPSTPSKRRAIPQADLDLGAVASAAAAKWAATPATTLL